MRGLSLWPLERLVFVITVCDVKSIKWFDDLFKLSLSIIPFECLLNGVFV